MQLSDIHLTADHRPVHGRDPWERLRTVLDVVRSEGTRPDVVVLTGDLTDDGSYAGCRNLANALAPLGHPILAVPGNHDDPCAVREVFGPDILEVGEWRIVGIDTSRPGQIHGTADVATEMSRLDRYDQRPTLLAMHHPPVSPVSHRWFQLEGAAELVMALAQRPYVRAILSGHLHHPFDSEASGIEVLGCPSSLIAFRHAVDSIVVGGARTTGARWCTLQDDGGVTSRLVQA
nr:metallophosphoesterase [Micromonospora tarapacensis]